MVNKTTRGNQVKGRKGGNRVHEPKTEKKAKYSAIRIYTKTTR